MAPEPHRPESRAPEGAHCAEHPERPAHFTCPRCGSYACIACWHPSIERCHQCLKRDPTEAAPPIPWERAGLGGIARFLGTLGTALKPVRTAPAFARQDVGAALRFMLLSALPFALLAGIIPHTRTLLFGGSFGVRVLGQASSGEIAVDVVRAMAVQLVLTGIDVACLLLPYVSLVRAYAPSRSHAAARVVLYRAWLLPGALLLYYLALWALPAPATAPEAPPPALLFVLVAQFVLVVVLFVAMGSTARLACGLGPFTAIIVVIVPTILLLLVNPLATMGMQQLMPPIPEQQAIAPGEG